MDNSLFESQDPNWSPDSKKIVFTQQANGTADIATINPDGSGLTQLIFNTPGRTFSFDPRYSPDSTKILFAYYPSTGGTDLFTMHPDGSGVTQATRTVSPELDPECTVAA
jgi:TolB protein